MARDTDWQPHRMPTLAIGRLARLLVKLNEERLRSIGITAAQLPVLVALKNGERRTQKELAQIAGIEQPSMAQLLARMERDDLVRREPARDDRRSSLVLLTDHAMKQLEPGRDALRSVDADACAGFTSAEREALTVMLERLVVNVTAALS